ncbi:MAG: conjugal transfer protein TraK [Chromatiaceae bacterium]|nr:MAG: conjugal transfer protein TraK [Chromatiaceae bacterium]
MRPDRRLLATALLVGPLHATGVLGAEAAPPRGFEVPVIPCQLLDGGCRPGAHGTNGAPVRAWGGPATPPALIRTLGNSGDVHRTTARRTSALELGPQTVTSRPGTTVLVEVAIGHLNRIVTPFRNPIVHTVSTASTQVDGSILYIASDSEEPVALFISDGPGSETALSLTLAPRHVPPREIRLQVPGYRAPPDTSAEALPQAHPAHTTALANPLGHTGPAAGGGRATYVGMLVERLRAMAQGHTPPGHTLQRGTAGMQVDCDAPLQVRRRTIARAPGSDVIALGVRNRSQEPVEIDQRSCRSADAPLAAMGAWPRRTLEAGEDTEVFLLLAPDQTGPSR